MQKEHFKHAFFKVLCMYNFAVFFKMYNYLNNEIL